MKKKIAVVAWVVIGVIDFTMVNSYHKPVFCVGAELADDGGSGTYVILLTLRATLCQKLKIQGLPHIEDTYLELKLSEDLGTKCFLESIMNL